MEALLTRPVVVGLAVLGGLLATAASFLQSRGLVSKRGGQILNYAGYGFMGASMLLYVLAGMLGAPG